MNSGDFADFIIIGGGTAGCVLARRLTESRGANVVVLEAGDNRVDDPRITTPGGAATLWGDPDFDWNFASVPQEHSYGKVISYPRGKTVGGSSAINVLALIYPTKKNIDGWGKLGNKGWSWDELEPYYRKFHTHNPPSEQTEDALGIDYIEKRLQGTSGPIQSSYSPKVSPITKAWPQTWKKLGWPTKGDPVSGDCIGSPFTQSTFDLKNLARSFAGNAYYAPVADRPNLRLETQAQVSKVIFETGGSVPKAVGVEYTSQGVTKTLKARKEVILAAGTFHTAQLLELSGIGSREVLGRAGIEIIVENPGVGENLQDHVMTGIAAQVRAGVPTGDLRRDPSFLMAAKEQFAKDRTGPLVPGITSNAFLPLNGWTDTTNLASAVNDAMNAIPATDTRPARHEQHAILRDIIVSPDQASIQVIFIPSQMHFDKSSYNDVFAVTEPENFITLTACLPQPFSAGSVHVSSADPKTLPTVDPRIMSHPLDVEVLGRHTAMLEKVLETAPLTDFIEPEGRRLPAESRLYEARGGEGELDAAKEHARRFIRSMSHPVGTAAMMPREKGGVVDERLRVHGVEGLRVVDASVFPMVPRGNIQATVYAVAERAADFVKQDWNLDV